jgi:hypothetical protein
LTVTGDVTALGELPELALFGHAGISKLSQLSGVKRKLDLDLAKGRAKPSFAARDIF